MSETHFETDITSGQTWARIQPESNVTVTRMHGDEQIGALVGSFEDGNFSYFNFAHNEGFRYTDHDPNRIWGNLDEQSGLEAERAERMVRILRENPGLQQGVLLDVHNTATTSPPFVIVAENDLFGEDERRVLQTRKLLSQIAITNIVTLPPELADQMLIGRDDLFQGGRALIEWPKAHDEADAYAQTAGAIERINNGVLVNNLLMAVHRVHDVIEPGTHLDGAENFNWYGNTRDGFVPLMYAHPDEKNEAAFSGDSQAKYWGFKADKVYPLPATVFAPID